MSDSTYIIIIVIVYLFSSGYVYYWMVKAHSDKGKWSNLTMDASDYIWILFPAMNTFVAFICVFSSPYRKKS